MDAQTLEKLQRIYDQADRFGKDLMEKEFPELKGNEDEDIRYFLIRFVKINTGVNISPDYAKKALAWLEKQTQWVEDNSKMKELFENLVLSLYNNPSAREILQIYGKSKDDCLNWLKSLK